MAASSVEFERFARQHYFEQKEPEISRQRHKEILARTLHEICDMELTERQRTAMELCFFQGMTVTQAAEIMGVHKSTVSRHITGAKKRIEKSLRYAAFRF